MYQGNLATSSATFPLQTFSFIGPITGLHLMKNLGIPVVKPDRHLTRIADVAGFNSVQELCESIQQSVGDGLSEIDLEELST